MAELRWSQQAWTCALASAALRVQLFLQLMTHDCFAPAAKACVQAIARDDRERESRIWTPGDGMKIALTLSIGLASAKSFAMPSQGVHTMPNRSQNQHKGSGRGFASMDAAKQRAIASAGGRAAHRSGNAHEFDVDEAREAGRRGGLARSASRASDHNVEPADGQGVMRMEDRDQEPGISRTPVRDSGHGERKGSPQTAEKHRTDAGNATAPRGKHH
jgi:uncharacterized protein